MAMRKARPKEIPPLCDLPPSSSIHVNLSDVLVRCNETTSADPNLRQQMKKEFQTDLTALLLNIESDTLSCLQVYIDSASLCQEACVLVYSNTLFYSELY